MKKEEFLTTCCGLGRLPFAPGTWGSLPPAVLYMAAGILFGPVPAVIVLTLLLVGDCVITVLYSPKVIELTGSKDPGRIVSDEVAGAALTLLLMHLLASDAGYCLTAALGFGLFRAFDIFKPWPCRRLEQLDAGWGILADDLAAGVWAAALWLAGRHLGVLEQLTGLLGVDGQMSAGFAIFLGIVQGLTEFLPVSSSGHLVFFETFAEGVDTQATELLFFDLCLHLGTVGSILVVFWKPMVRFFRHLVGAVQSGLSPLAMYEQKAALRVAVLAIVSTFTTGVFYVLFKGPLEAARSLQIVSLMWLVTAGLLLAADARHGKKGLKEFGIMIAIIIGLFQGFAILPGISRSGATICAAILLGMKLRWAIEFSFLISIPAIVGGAAVQVIKHHETLFDGSVPMSYTVWGALSAFIVGIVALKLLIRVAKKRKLKYFAAYCIAIATLTLIYCLGRSC
ncbi:MAG: hypothetical protein GXY41_09365 [Phycisphaerae bacterium]|nr:hypothetical protein [Phycisphaerae bacterium]